jgi:hypothetical protein
MRRSTQPLRFNPRYYRGNQRPVNIYSIRSVPITYAHKSLISVHWSHTAENQKQKLKEHLDPQSAQSERLGVMIDELDLKDCAQLVSFKMQTFDPLNTYTCRKK